jgi:hypothetical protein
MRNEYHDTTDYGPVPPNEDVWAAVCEGRARRVYAFGGPVLENRFLPHALGLEPVQMHAYRYDAQGGLNRRDDYLRIATQLARDEGWLAFDWAPACADVFMREAEAIIWLDDTRARFARSLDLGAQEPDPLSTLVHAIQRGVRNWRRRHSDDDDSPLFEIAEERRRPVDPVAVLAHMTLGQFPEKVLRVSYEEQLRQLNAVRRTR